MRILVDWARFKSLKDTNSWTIYYKTQGSTAYRVWCGTNNHQLEAIIESTDKTDFENNYKTGATVVACEGDAISRIVTF